MNFLISILVIIEQVRYSMLMSC